MLSGHSARATFSRLGRDKGGRLPNPEERSEEVEFGHRPAKPRKCGQPAEGRAAGCGRIAPPPPLPFGLRALGGLNGWPVDALFS